MAITTPLSSSSSRRFKRVLKQDPDNTAALLGLAGIYQNANRFQEAHDTFLIASRANPQNPIPFYSIGAIDWIMVFDRNKPLPLGEQFLLVDEGLSNLDSALALNPQYEDAMTYKNLLLREKARLVVDPEEKARLTKLADEWFNRALETRKSKALERTTGRPVGPSSGVSPLPPPLPPPPPEE